MKQSLSARLIYRIMAVVLVMMAIIAGVVNYTVREYMLDEAKERYMGIMFENRQELRRRLSDVYVATQNNVHEIERDLNNPDLLFAHVERIVRKNPSIVCSGLLFEPGYYPGKGEFFVPFASRDSAGTVSVTRIDSIYHSYANEDWYLNRMKGDKADWTDAFFENSALTNSKQQRLLVTYAVPIHDAEGRPVALLCSDLSLEGLRRKMMEDDEEINQKFEKDLDHQSYSFIVDSIGTFIIHPNKALMLQDTLATAYKMEEKRGEATVTIRGVKSWIYYRKVPYVEWTMVIVVPEDTILSNARGLNIIILLVMIGGLVAIYLFCRHQIKEIADPFAAQKAAVDRELTIAHDIQMGMLPKPLSPLTSNLSIDALLKPAKEVGGDLYDYFLRDGCLYFCIGDVSGKGIPAALVMSMARSAFRSLAESEKNPARIVKRMNESMARDNDLCLFITMFVGVLDLTTGHLSYCNAGHKKPYIIDNGQLIMDNSAALDNTDDNSIIHYPLSIINCNSNLPVGVMPDWEFTLQEAVLAPGSTLFVYTDGLDEAEDAQHQMFGKERIVKTLESASLNPHDLISTMKQAVADFVGNTEQSDDLTMMAIRVDVT